MLSWLVLQLTDSVAAVAALAAARGLPMLLLAYVGGTLADRVSRLRLLRITQSITLAIVAAYAVYLAIAYQALGSPVAWSAHLVIGLVGAVWSFDFANRRSLYTELFEPGELATAVPVDTVTFTAGLIVGPLIAGVLTRTGGFAVAYAGLAAMHAASVLLLPPAGGGARRPSPSARAGRTAIAERVRTALATLRGQRALQATVAVTLVSNFFAFPFHQMVPVIGRDVLDADALRFGILVAAWGVGALAGSFTLAARAVRRPAWVFFAGMSSLFVCIAGFALSGAYLLSVGLLLAGGIGFSGFASMQILIALRAAPPELRGRALGVVGLAIGVNPLGNLILGLVAEQVGPQAALAAFALLGLSGLALVRWRYPELGRRAALSEPAPGPAPPAG